jgi:virginiamycin B lyase
MSFVGSIMAQRNSGCWKTIPTLLIAVTLAQGAQQSGDTRRPGNIVEHEFATGKSGPSVVMASPDGKIWVAMAKAGKIACFFQDRLSELSLPNGAFPVGIAVAKDGGLWYSDIHRNCIGKLDAITGVVKEYNVPTANAWPFFVVIDARGMIWFTERVGNRIGCLDPTNGAIAEIPVTTPHCQPAGLAITPQGQLYFTENSANKIGHWDPERRTLDEYPVPSPASPGPYYGPAGICSDEYGNIWFCELDGRIGRIRKGTAAIEEFDVPNKHARPAGIVTDKWGLVWFTQLDANSVVSFHVNSGTFREYPVPSGEPDATPLGPPEATARGDMPGPGPTARTSRPFGIAVDTGGRVWFSEQYAHKLGMLTPPKVEILAPTGVIDTLDPQVLPFLRIPPDADTSPVVYTLDGRDIPATSRLDLSHVGPGTHRFSIRVGNNNIFSALTEFVLRPNLEFLLALAHQVRPTIERDIERLEGARDSVRVGRTDVARELVRSLIRDLSTRTTSSTQASVLNTFIAHLRFYDLFCARSYDLPIENSGFTVGTFIIEAGDSVRVKNLTRHKIMVASREALLATTEVRPGETLRCDFPREGTFSLMCSEGASPCVATIVVGTRTTFMEEFTMPGFGRVPTVIKIDQKGNAWFTEGGGGFSKLAAVPLNNRIGRLSNDGTIQEYSTPTADSAPTSIALDTRGHLWFTERAGNNIGDLNEASGYISEFPIPTAHARATGIDVDKRTGAVWFTEKDGGKVGMLDPSTGKIVEYNTPSKNSMPSTVAVDQEGCVWFDERASDNLACLDPKTGEIKTYKIPTAKSRVVGITPDKNGHVWFVQLAGHKLGKLDINSSLITEYAIPTQLCTPFKLALDEMERVWLTEVFGNKIAVLDNDARFVEFAIPTNDGMPGGITIDNAGNVWFAEQAADKIAKIPGAAAFSDREYRVEPSQASSRDETAPEGEHR